MGAAEHCKPYSHSLGKIPIRVLPKQSLQPQARKFHVGDHRNWGLKDIYYDSRAMSFADMSQDSKSW